MKVEEVPNSPFRCTNEIEHPETVIELDKRSIVNSAWTETCNEPLTLVTQNMLQCPRCKKIYILLL